MWLNADFAELSNVQYSDRRMTDRFTAKALRGAEGFGICERLRKVGVDAERWEIEYIDDGTGDRWLLDYPESEQHGGGSPRLRKLPAR